MTDIIGTDGQDSLIGTSGADSIQGLGGDDLIDGGDGRDTLDGGAGNDSIYGGLRADLILGGDGDDYLVSGMRGGYTGNEPGNTLQGGTGDDRMSLHAGDIADGGSGRDSFFLSFAKSSINGAQIDLRGLDGHGSVTFLGTTIANVEAGELDGTGGDDVITIGRGAFDAGGGDGDDQITGGRGANRLYGGDGDDTLIGGGGGDQLSGGAGDDRLVGGAGQADMGGGAGNDTLVVRSVATLFGGGGADMFQITRLAGADSTIYDLDGHDVVNLKQIDADITQAGNQRFRLVDHLDGHAGQAALELVDGVTYLRLDVDGDGTADASLGMQGDHTGFSGFLL
jgi:Ca2+-binding RTX toxin-like protein